MNNGPAKTGDDRLRWDLEPLKKRLPKLASVRNAVWKSGILGDPHIPGPSTYWIDAIVDLDDATAAEVSVLPGLALTAAPEVVTGLDPWIPVGELTRSVALDNYFRTPEWSVDAWLSPSTKQAVLLIDGGNL